MPANTDELQKGAQRLAGVLLGDVERMADRSAQRMQELLPAYARVPRCELIPVVHANTRNLLETIHDPDLDRPSEQLNHRASGETRARQGITLDEMLHGWRIGLEVVREEAYATAEELEVGEEALLEFVEALLRWGDIGMRVSAAAHREAEVRELTRLAAEQAALRRVATLVAQGAPSTELFAAVAEQVACVLTVPVVQIARYEPDGTATLLATFGECGGAGLRSTVASPIVVSGQVWGATMVCSPETEPLPSDTDSRLTDFNELVSAAIAGAHARDKLERPAAEQAALRRVATLVARGAPPDEVFGTVAEEVAGLLPVTSAAMGRFDPDGMVTTVAAWSAGGIAFPVTRRWDPKGNNVTGIVLATGRSARIDDFSDASGPVGVHARDAGYRSAVGSPITVDGRLWGIMSAASSLAEPLPADAEARLASFTELVAAAIANTESRSGLRRCS
jgi:GAF domain-containing protein